MKIHDPLAPIEGAIMSLNCNGWTTKVKQGNQSVLRRSVIFREVKCHKAIIVGIHETYFTTRPAVE